MLREIKNKYYLYKHIRLDKNEIFYIGVGSKPPHYTVKVYKRAYSHYARNRFWHFIVRKTDFRVEIIEESDDRNYISKREVELIKFYGRRNLGKGTLCNLTDGGDANYGYIPSEETRAKLRACKTGSQVTEKTKEKLRIANYKPIILIDDGKKVEYQGIIFACNELKISRTCIDRALKTGEPTKFQKYKFIFKPKK